VEKGKRPIDRQRDSAFSMSVGEEGDGPSRDSLPIGHKMYLLMDRAIYSIVLADNIDPARTNPNIRHMQQKAYDIGTQSELVGRTLLAAKYLFKDGMLDQRFDKDRIFLIVLDFFEEVLGLSKIFESFVEEMKRPVASANERQQQGSSVLLPSVPDLKGKVKAFVQRAEHGVQSLLALCKVFYDLPPNKSNFDGLFAVASVRDDLEPFLLQILEGIVRYAKFLRNCRHCVEHPHPHQRIVITNFILNANNEVWPPVLEIIHPQTPEPTIDVGVFMRDVLNSTLSAGENLMAFLASTNMLPDWKERAMVMEFPPEKRRNPHVKYYYAMNLGGEMCPIG